MSNAHLGLNIHDPAFAQARLAIAEATGDRLAVADALSALGLFSLREARVYTRLLFRASVDIAREEQRPAVTSRNLMYLSLSSVVDDLAQANALNEEALEEMQRAGGNRFFMQLLICNRSLLALELANLDLSVELAEAIDGDAPPGAYIAPFVHAVLADVRGSVQGLVVPPDEARSSDDKSVTSLAASADMFAAKRAGDLSAATRAGLQAVLEQYEFSGFSDDLVHIWPFAANSALAAGDQEVVDRLLALVDDEPPGFVGIGMRAHRQRIAALRGVQNGAAEVERQLRGAIDEFVAWGSPLWAARTRAELAVWLANAGRADEAAVPRQQATELLRAAGANGWLAELGLVDSPVAAEAGTS
jgi:hypothetical protein